LWLMIDSLIRSGQALNRSLPHTAWQSHPAFGRACDSRKTQTQATQIASRIVDRFAAFFYRAEQLGHRPVKTFAEPRSFERRLRMTLGGINRNGLFRQARAGADNRAFGSRDDSAVFLAVFDVGVEDD